MSVSTVRSEQKCQRYRKLLEMRSLTCATFSKG